MRAVTIDSDLIAPFTFTRLVLLVNTPRKRNSAGWCFAGVRPGAVPDGRSVGGKRGTAPTAL